MDVDAENKPEIRKDGKDSEKDGTATSPEDCRAGSDSDRRRKNSTSRSPDHRRKRSRSTSRSRSRSRSRDRRRHRSRSKSKSRGRRRRDSRDRSSKSRSRSRTRSRSRSRGKRRYSRSPVRRRRSSSRSPSRSPVGRGRYGGVRRDRSPPPWRRGGRFNGAGGGFRGRRSPPNRGYGNGAGSGYGSFGGRGGRARQSIERARSVRSESPDLPEEERDHRTVFCMQLAQTINAKDLEKLFSSVGKVRDVRLIVDSKTRRSKGIAYVEFRELEAVPLALGLHGQRLKGCPMNIQPTQAEKNRAAMAAAGAVQKGPMRLYVGSLHFNITEDMLKDIFDPFGKIDSLQLMMDPETNRSRGYAFITFHDAQDAKRAMEQLNGFELAGRAMKIGHVTDRTDTSGGGSLEIDDTERAGFDLGPTGRLQLMAKLAEGTGMKIPTAAVQQPQPAQPIATQCFMLSNMFDSSDQGEPNWDKELRQEIIDECSNYGGVAHVEVDKASNTGNVYVKAASVAAAVSAVQHLHGRYFAGKMITANYIPVMNYHQLFPDSLKTLHALKTSEQLG